MPAQPGQQVTWASPSVCVNGDVSRLAGDSSRLSSLSVIFLLPQGLHTGPPVIQKDLALGFLPCRCPLLTFVVVPERVTDNPLLSPRPCPTLTPGRGCAWDGTEHLGLRGPGAAPSNSLQAGTFGNTGDPCTMAMRSTEDDFSPVVSTA